MNILNKLFLRSPVFVSVITLLLAAVTAFSSIGFSAWYSAQLQISEINSQYTTIAIPYDPNHAGQMPGGFETESLSGTTIYISGSMTEIDEVLQNSPVAVKKDDRILLGAYIEGTASATLDTTLTPLSILDSSIDEYFVGFDERYNDAVFAVKCTSVKDSSTESISANFDDDGNLVEEKTVKLVLYDCEFSVEKTLCMRDSIFPEPETIVILSNLATESGEPIFEVGKTYLIRGRYMPSNRIDRDTGTLFKDGSMDMNNGRADSGLSYEEGDGFIYYLPRDEILPLYAPYEGDLDAFLASDEGRIWTDEIIPAAQKNYSSAMLMLTDNVDSMYWFNTGEAAILDGRSIDPEEYAAGSDVCMISLTYAELNGLSVGDTLDMELYSISLFTLAPPGFESDLIEIWTDPLTPEKALGITKKYTVAGIYTAPVGVHGTYAFGPDMIFVPKSSVPGWENLESNADVPQLHSLMIENGKTEEFDEYMSANGYPDSFLYFDQSYGEMDDSVKALRDNAVRLALSGAALFLVTLLVYLILVTNKMRPTVLSMRRIGISGGKCLAQSQSSIIPLLLCSLAVGTALGVVMFGTVSSLILSANIRLSAAAVIICTCAQLGLMLILEFASCNSLSRQKLIKNKGVKNG